MSRASATQTNFTSGEVSPLMRGRIDVARYQNGVALMENMIVRPQGGATRRSGTRHVYDTRDSARASRLVPFRFSDQQSYALEFGRHYIRVHNQGRVVLDETFFLGTVSAIASNGGSIKVTFNNDGKITTQNTTASPNNEERVTCNSPHGLVTGDRVIFYGVTYTVTYVSDTVIDLQGTTFAGFSAAHIFTKNLISGSSNNGGLIRITTYESHGLATGDKIYMGHSTDGVDFSGTPGTFDWVVTVISDVQFDLQGSVYTAGSDAEDDSFVKWPKPGEDVKISGNNGTMVLNGLWRIKSVQFHDVVTLANSTHSGTTGGTIRIAYLPVEVITPYTEADLAELKFAQSADIIWLFHGSYPTRKLLRYSSNVWKFQLVDWRDGPYLPLNSLAPAVNPVNPEQGTKYLDVFVEVSAYTHTAKVKSAANFTDATDDDGAHYLEYRQDDDQWRLALIQAGSIAASDLKTATVTIIDNVLLFLDESVRLRNALKPLTIGSVVSSISHSGAGRDKRVDSNNEVQTDGAGVLYSQFSNTFGVADVGKYVRYHTTPTAATAVWAQITGIPRAQTGLRANHGTAVMQAAISTSGAGKFVLVNEVRTCTLKAFRGQDAFSMWSSSDVGRSIRMSFSGRWTWGKITVFTSASQVTATLYENMPRDPHNAANLAGDGMTFQWRMGAWSTATGYPRTACFHEQRLWMGGTSAEPQTFHGSRSGDFENMSPTDPDSTVPDDAGITYTIVSGEVNPIRWMISGPVLLIGGLGQEWQVRAASSIAEPITPTNISVTPQTAYGSSETVDPIRIGTSVIFVNRAGTKVRELNYNFQIDAFEARDVSIISEHIPKDAGGIKFADYQRDPVNIWWAVLNDGTLAGMTFERDQEVVGWHRHLIAGTDANVESLAVLPSIDGLSDHVYLIVNRNVGGAGYRRQVEYVESFFQKPSVSDKTTMFFCDSGITFNFSPTRTVIEGLDHLESEELVILRDGVIETQSVAAGTVTLDVAGAVVSLGLPTTALVRTLPPEAGGTIGSAQTRTKRTHKVGLRVVDSLRVEHSGDGSNWETRVLGGASAVGNFFTGDDVVSLTQRYDREGSFYLRNSFFEPLTLLLLNTDLKTYEEQ